VNGRRVLEFMDGHGVSCSGYFASCGALTPP
jgi:hypothetical protein